MLVLPSLTAIKVDNNPYTPTYSIPGESLVDYYYDWSVSLSYSCPSTGQAVTAGSPAPTLVTDTNSGKKLLFFNNVASGLSATANARFPFYRPLEEYTLIYIFKSNGVMDTQGVAILMSTNSYIPSTNVNSNALVLDTSGTNITAIINTAVGTATTQGGSANYGPIWVNGPVSTTSLNILIWTGLNTISDRKTNTCLRLNGTPYYDTRINTPASDRRAFINVAHTTDNSVTARIGAASGYSFRGHIGHAIKLNKAISPEYAQILEGYYATYWNIRSVLPNDHPYKNAAPTMAEIPSKILYNQKTYSYIEY